MSLTKEVFAAFRLYSKRFSKFDPELVVEHYHQPAVLMTSEEVAFMHNPDEIKAVFVRRFEELEKYEFHHSELDSAHVKQLSKNQALLSGVASRYREDNSLIGNFGFSYTFRKDQGNWKIIAGVIHDSNEFMFSEPPQLPK